jgi:uncharacterized protein
VNVDVAYVGPEGTVLVTVTVDAGATVGDAIIASGIVGRLQLFEAALSYAIHGQRAERATPLRAGDRVELLRPLKVDPKEARRARAGRRRTGALR